MKTATIPKLPAQLGYAGLLPFLLIAVALWLVPATWHDRFVFALIGYAVVILSFMGAIHWGLGMLHPGNAGSWQLGLSVIPPLLAWIALMLPAAWAFALLISGFGILCLTDVYAARRKLVPDWYPRLRIPLSIIVILSLIAAELAIAWRQQLVL